MAAPFSYLHLVYGDVDVDLLSLDGTGAHLQASGYAPRGHRRRRGRAGGLGTHENQETALTFNIEGDTASDCLQTLADITYVLDNATDGEKHGDVLPPRLLCLPVGSVEPAPLTAYLVQSDNDPIELPGTFLDTAGLAEIQGVRIRLTHKPWVGADEVSTPSPAQVAPFIVTSAWTHSRAIPSPMQLIVSTGLSWVTGSAPMPPMLLLVANKPERLAVVEAENSSYSYSLPWAVAAAAGASGGQIVRYPSPDANWSTGAPISLPQGFQDEGNRRVAIYAVLKVAVGDFEVGIAAGPSDVPTEMTEAEPVLVELATHVNPTLTYIGTVTEDGGLRGVALRARALTGLGTLEVDRLLFLALDDVTSRAITIDGNDARVSAPAWQPEWRTSRWWETGRTQLLATLVEGQGFALDHDGRTDLVSTGSVVSMIWDATGNEDVASWRATQDGNPVTAQVRAVRAPLFTVPQ